MEDDNLETVWVFNGANAAIPSAVFRGKEEAIQWIKEHRLTGMLTEYPVGISLYDWVIKEGKWRPTKQHQSTPEFIAKFTCAYLDHYHFEDGEE